MARKGQHARRFTEQQKAALSALKKYAAVKESVSVAWKVRDEAEKVAVAAHKDYKSASYKVADEAASIILNFDDLVVKSKHDTAMVVDLIKQGFEGKVGIVGKYGGRFYSYVSRKLGHGAAVQLYSIP